MIGDNRKISLKVRGRAGSAASRDAESLGLIVTELVINSLKHAFNENTKDGQITVAYDVDGTDWKLSIADNGVGSLCLCPTKNRAWHWHRQGARETTGCQVKLRPARGNDRIGHSRHLFGKGAQCRVKGGEPYSRQSNPCVAGRR